MESTGRLFQMADGRWQELQSHPDEVLAVTLVEEVGTRVEAKKKE